MIVLFFCLIFVFIQNVKNQTEGDSAEDDTILDSDQAPNFNLTTLNGEEIELKDLQGKGVLVNFWSSWCGPCKNEMPEIQKVYDFYKSQGLEVLAVNYGESKETIQNFLEDHPTLNFTILLEDDQVSEKYMIANLPTTYFINKDGEIVNRYMGELNEEQLHVFVNEILPKE
ncbi:Thiol-disulfide isomerase or thioredoxin [Tenuibacillus multivorans]|uniref:Thiol-disulfide isomerase or thioredoxin n=1 Tax=Tenuibacillus multivorans TaxID=237069 RepID=A0A1H0CLD9_9BACI|nr:redoxin domain-containing protein [Tenuibacillus multivorans]SDN58706.1 Thiol-disulfide isomerase or thioredoxin [Tenuibacillus multivorans]